MCPSVGTSDCPVYVNWFVVYCLLHIAYCISCILHIVHDDREGEDGVTIFRAGHFFQHAKVLWSKNDLDFFEMRVSSYLMKYAI